MKGFWTKKIKKGENLKEIEDRDFIEMNITRDYTIPS
jgi:hypothetical protein